MSTPPEGLERNIRMDAPGESVAVAHTNRSQEDEPTNMEDSLVDTDADEERRGRLKRRRLSSHTPPRASSPSRGHERDSGSRHRHHYRKHRRRSSSDSVSPPPTFQKNRRRSDAEPDHTLRGRARNRSGDKRRTRSPILEGEGFEEPRGVRRRSPPSRRRSDGELDGGLRRQRSLPNMYKVGSAERGKGTQVDGEMLYEENQSETAPAVQQI
ncbi:hypothetical protein BS50DRAFT_576396 [Corynespora cassiicola Philippines]|uniref:Uncharacterized protein n=1 Tax=Corynespora cassiicola Philippines TaxID=1448308 RepID=A0A2T2NEB1_CORCC|nr:hypothetical protein BS50DRAFT_576396 [Corynespora cassiicola Philippines]